MPEQLANNAVSTLTAAMGAGDATLTVASAAAFPAKGNFRILIDIELILVTAVAGSTFTISRAQEGTAAASHSNGATVTHLITADSMKVFRSDAAALSLCEGRLTLTSGVPVTTADVTGATTIYFTPYKGNRITLWNGGEYVIDQFAETSIALGNLTGGLPYDLFAYDNAGAVAFDAPLAWANTTTRATALSWNNGSLVKSGDATRRYVGTFYTTAATTTEDSAQRRFLFNAVNRVPRFMSITTPTATWTTVQNGVWRQANGDANNRVQAVVGWADSLIDLMGFTLANGSSGGSGFDVGIGVDSTTSVPAECFGMVGVTPLGATTPTGTYAAASCRYVQMPTVGYHAWNWLENSDNNATTFFGSRAASAGNSQIRCGLNGYLEA